MVESGRKKDSTIIDFDEKGRKPQRQKKENNGCKKKKGHKRNTSCIIIGFVVGILFVIVVYLTIKYNCADDILAWIADKIIELLAGGVLVEFAVVYIGFKVDQNNGEDITIVSKAIAGGILIIFLFLFGLLIKVSSIVAENELHTKTVDVANTENSSENNELSQKAITSYVLEQDIYMDKYPLEMYYGKPVSDEERVDVMVEILLRDLEQNRHNENKSSNYVQQTEIADAEYNAYLYIRNMEEEIENKNVKKCIFDDSVEMLKKSLERRENADKECKTVENERPLAAGYKEMGDMYVQKGMQNEAIDAYESSSINYIKVIYYAAVQGNIDEVDECMRQFEKLGDEVKKLDEISVERRDNITQMILVYRKFKERYTSSYK